MSTKPKSHSALGNGGWMVRLWPFTSSGIWPSGGGNKQEKIKNTITFKDIIIIIIMITSLQFCNFCARKTLTVSGLHD